MLFFQQFGKFLLVGAALGCLSIAGVSSSISHQETTSEAEDATSHRGSGRVVSQVPPSQFPQSFSLHQNSRTIHQIAGHRGSGRINQEGQDTKSVAYRGSGRISKLSIHTPDWS